MFFPSLLRRANALPKFDFARNPYKSKRTWPPDFTKLSQKHQFRLERRYRRRAKLKWARPTWTKFVKLSTWATISCMYHLSLCDKGILTLCSVVVVYGLLFMDIEEGTVFGTVCRFSNIFCQLVLTLSDPRLLCKSDQRHVWYSQTSSSYQATCYLRRRPVRVVSCRQKL